jgi:threonine aldolase
VGSAPFVAEARRLRKALGGGMRQVGVLAACGLLSLEEMARPARLQEDIRRARQLSDALAAMPHVTVANHGNPLRTNMVYLRADPSAVAPDALTAALAARGVRCCPFSEDGRARFVTHYEVTDEALDGVIAAFREALEEAAL